MRWRAGTGLCPAVESLAYFGLYGLLSSFRITLEFLFHFYLVPGNAESASDLCALEL